MRISVLLPTYNSEQYLSEAINSILQQTFKDYEFLILDDGSTDNTEKVVNSFKDKRIRYVKKEHSGLTDSLNFGLKIAQYNWIARMDADDISHPERLEVQVNYLSSHPEIDWISCWYAVFDNKLRYLFKLPEKSKEIVRNLVLSSSVCFAGSIFKKDKVLEANGFRGEVFEDYELLLRLKNQIVFYNIQNILYYQRRKKKSLSTGNLEEKKNVIYNIQQPYFKNLENEFGLKSSTETIRLRGWREYFYGSKINAFNNWNKLNIKLILYPITFLGYMSLLIPDSLFIYSKKFFFRILLFYSPIKTSMPKKKFMQLKTTINKNKLIKIYGIKLNLVKEIDLLNISRDAVENKSNINIVSIDFRHFLYLKNNKLLVDTSDNYFFYPDSSGIWFLLKTFYNKNLYNFKRIVSSDFHFKLLDLANKESYRIFLLGDTTDTLNSFIVKIQNEFKNIQITGYSNGFEDLKQQNLIEKINMSNSDVLLIGLGVPQKENWLNENSNKINVPLRITVGAFFTFYSRTIKRAPVIFSKLYLEWLFRLMKEPKRLFGRYFIQFPKVFILILRERCSKKI